MQGTNLFLFDVKSKDFPTPYTEQTSASAVRSHVQTLSNETRRRREIEASMASIKAERLERDLEERRRKEAWETADLGHQCKSALSYFRKE